MLPVLFVTHVPGCTKQGRERGPSPRSAVRGQSPPVLAVLPALPFTVAARDGAPSDDAVAKRLIAESIANYSGACACPYNATKNGSRCGKRSAYSKPGGASPLCYRRDVSEAMIEAYRARK